MYNPPGAGNRACALTSPSPFHYVMAKIVLAMQLAAHAKSSTLHGRSCGNLEPRVILAPCQRYGRRIMTSEIIDDWFVYEDLPLFIKKTLRKVIVRKFKFFHFKVVRVCSFVCCNGVCKSCLSFPKTKFEWYTPTRHKEISCSFCCAIYGTNVQTERTWKDSPRAYICCRTEIKTSLALSLRTNCLRKFRY